MHRILLYVWAFPNTLLALPFVALALATRGHFAFRGGILEVHGGIVSWLLRRCTGVRRGAQALTLGHVVLGQDAAALDITRTHERVHVYQYQRWGPLFLPAYLGASLFLALSGRDAYRENPFERQAFLNS